MKGISIRSLQRFCSDKGIHKTAQASTEAVDDAVVEAVAKVMNWVWFIQDCALGRV